MKMFVAPLFAPLSSAPRMFLPGSVEIKMLMCVVTGPGSTQAKGASTITRR